MGTYFQSAEEAREAGKWLVIDAADMPLGRLASQVAQLIRGKHRPQFTRHANGGDFVIVVNAEKIRLTGKKLEQKIYYRHSGYAGGLKEVVAYEFLRKDPEGMIQHAVRGMLPKGALGHTMLRKLKVYKGAEHPHKAQQPEKIEFSI